MLTYGEFTVKITDIGSILNYNTKIEPKEKFPRYRYARLQCCDTGAVFTIQNGGYQNEDRFEIYGTYPHSTRGPLTHTDLLKAKITVSDKRTAQSIAKDIESRFIPPFLENFATMTKRVNDIDRHWKNQRAAAQAAGAILGIEPHFDHDSVSNARFYTPRGDLTSYGEDTFDVRITNLTLDELRIIAPVLNPELVKLLDTPIEGTTLCYADIIQTAKDIGITKQKIAALKTDHEMLAEIASAISNNWINNWSPVENAIERILPESYP